MIYNTPIPSVYFSEHDVSFEQEDEPLIYINDSDEFCIDMQYIKQGVEGATKECMLRSSVLDHLLIAASYLPKGYKFKIYDAWRPLKVQEFLYHRFYDQIAMENASLNDLDLKKKISSYVSIPTNDPLSPPVHCTGGAIDLTVIDEFGKELNMGTKFDEFNDKSHTYYFESSNNVEVIKNRRLLYNIMIMAEFVNLPSEWWHYEYGTKFWGCLNQKPFKYSGIFTF